MRGQRERRDRVEVEPALELGGEQQVRQLALAVGAPPLVATLAHEVVEVHAPHAVGAGRHRDDPRARPGDQCGQEEAGEREVAEVVGPELHLEAVGGRATRDRHDARVVDQQVEPLRVLVRPGVGEAADGGEVGEVQAAHPHGRGGRLGEDPVPCLGSLARIADGERDVGAVGGELPGRLEADPGVGARHHGGPSGQVGHVVGGPAQGIGHGPSQPGRPHERSSPLDFLPDRAAVYACVAFRPFSSLVERSLGKGEVPGPIPGRGSMGRTLSHCAAG